VAVAHALALAATDMMMFIYMMLIPHGPPIGLLLVALCSPFVVLMFCSPFVLVLPLALQNGMPRWIFELDVVLCIAALCFGVFLIFSSRSNSMSGAVSGEEALLHESRAAEV
jgi:hypothetical protein